MTSICSTVSNMVYQRGRKIFIRVQSRNQIEKICRKTEWHSWWSPNRFSFSLFDSWLVMKNKSNIQLSLNKPILILWNFILLYSFSRYICNWHECSTWRFIRFKLFYWTRVFGNVFIDIILDNKRIIKKDRENNLNQID